MVFLIPRCLVVQMDAAGKEWKGKKDWKAKRHFNLRVKIRVNKPAQDARSLSRRPSTDGPAGGGSADGLAALSLRTDLSNVVHAKEKLDPGDHSYGAGERSPWTRRTGR